MAILFTFIKGKQKCLWLKKLLKKHCRIFKTLVNMFLRISEPISLWSFMCKNICYEATHSNTHTTEPKHTLLDYKLQSVCVCVYTHADHGAILFCELSDIWPRSEPKGWRWRMRGLGYHGGRKEKQKVWGDTDEVRDGFFLKENLQWPLAASKR